MEVEMKRVRFTGQEMRTREGKGNVKGADGVQSLGNSMLTFYRQKSERALEL